MIHRIARLLLVVPLMSTCPRPVRAAITIVSPNGLEHVEGTGRLDAGRDAFRTQMLYRASDFSSLPDSGAWLVGFAERLDSTETSMVTASWDDLHITLSTTQRDSLSTDFSQNVGPDAVVVQDGPLQVTYEVDPNSNRNPFLSAAQSQLDAPFFYDPGAGNLLVEFVSQSGVGATFFFDSESTGSVVSTVASGNPASSTAEVSLTRNNVEMFIFVPEPSAIALAAIAVVGTLILPCARRSSGPRKSSRDGNVTPLA